MDVENVTLTVRNETPNMSGGAAMAGIVHCGRGWRQGVMADYDLWYIFPDGRKVFIGPVVQGVIVDGACETITHYTTLVQRGGGRVAHKLNSPAIPLRETKKEAAHDLHMYIINRWDGNYSSKVWVYINGFVVGWDYYIEIITGRKEPPQSSDTKARGCTMAQEQTAAKRCETCGRQGACPSMRKDRLTDITSMKLENSPGYCGHWVDGSKFKFALPGPGVVYEAERGTPLLIYERDAAGNWKLPARSVNDTMGGTTTKGDAPQPASSMPPAPQEENPETLPAMPAGPEINFKALDKLVDVAKIKELGMIEARINIAKHQTMGALLEIGRCLNDAKDRDLVPHGQFEAWAAEQTGMGERTRQRVMQAAREVPAGSAMERLDFTKTMTLLALPEGDREEIAEKAEAEKTPLRKLQDEVGLLTKNLAAAQAAEKREKDYRLGQVGQKEKRIQDLTSDVLEGEMAKLELHKAKQALEAQAQATKQALERLQDLEKASADGVPPEHGISKEAQLMLDKHADLIGRLRQEKADAERYAEEQAKLRQEAQQDMLRLKSQAAHGQSAVGDDLTGESLAEAVRLFLGAAGVLPHMGKMLCQLPAQERDKFQRNVAMLAGWVEGARLALDMVAGEVAVSDMEEA